MSSRPKGLRVVYTSTIEAAVESHVVCWGRHRGVHKRLMTAGCACLMGASSSMSLLSGMRSESSEESVRGLRFPCPRPTRDFGSKLRQHEDHGLLQSITT
eukprot:6481289-Amphidinium_carterae.3